MAKLESSKLHCLANEIELLIEMEPLRSQQVDQMCSVLPQFIDSQKNFKRNEELLKVYRNVNDHTLRPISQSESEKNKEAINYLENRQNYYGALGLTIQENTQLLTNPVIKQFVNSLIAKNISEKEICTKLKSETTSLLKESLVELKKSQEDLLKMEKDGPTDEVKSLLWNSASRDDFLTLLAQKDEALAKKTSCQMEARYDRGLILKNKLVTVFSVGSGLSFIGPGRVAAALYASRANLVARTLTVGVFSLNAMQTAGYFTEAIENACYKDKPKATATSSCDQLSQNQKISLMYQRNEESSCALQTGLALFNGAAAAVGLSGINKIFSGSLAQEIGSANGLTAQLISKYGFRDFIQVAKIESTPIGKLITVKRKPNVSEWADSKIRGPDPVFNPNITVDNLGPAANKMGFSKNSEEVTMPYTDYYNARIKSYNSKVSNKDRLSTSYYETNVNPTDGKYYVKKFVNEGALPIGRIRKSSLLNTDHLALHDITAHGTAITIPREFTTTAQKSYSAILKFEDFIKAENPTLWSKITSDRRFERVYKYIDSEIDGSTGNWTLLIEAMRNGDKAKAARFINFLRVSFLKNKTASEQFDEILTQGRIHLDPNLLKLAKEYKLTFNSTMHKKPMGNAEANDSVIVDYLYKRHLETLTKIEKQNF